MNDLFRRFAHRVSLAVGSPWSFLLAFALIAFWTMSGWMYGFSDSWQLIINTVTTILTFLIVFLIQNTQNRDAKAIHLKLDELLRAGGHARNSLVDLEEFSDDELDKLEKEFRIVSERAKIVAERRRQKLHQ